MEDQDDNDPNSIFNQANVLLLCAKVCTKAGHTILGLAVHQHQPSLATILEQVLSSYPLSKQELLALSEVLQLVSQVAQEQYNRHQDKHW